MDDASQEWVGAWAKDYYFAVRSVADAVLRPYDLGRSQWFVLHHLMTDGPMLQSDLRRRLRIEGATLSAIVAALVQKQLIDQTPGSEDHRQRLLQVTDAGRRLWDELPDPLAVVREISSDDSDPAAIATARRVLREATQRLNAQLVDGRWSASDHHR